MHTAFCYESANMHACMHMGKELVKHLCCQWWREGLAHVKGRAAVLYIANH